MEVVQQAVDFLRGRLGAVERGIVGEMAAAAAAQEFERAARLRDRLAAVRHVHERQAARIEGGEAFDVIGLHQGEPGANVQVLSLIHISEPTRLGMISYAVFCLKKKKQRTSNDI